MEAIYTFTPDADDQIALEIGDHITQTSDIGNGWLLGNNLTQDKFGIFPASYVRKQHGFRVGARRSFARINSIFARRSMRSREAIPVSAPTATGVGKSHGKESSDNLTPTIDKESIPVYDNYQSYFPKITDPGMRRPGQASISDASGQYVSPDQLVAPPRMKHKQKSPKLAHYLSMAEAQSTTSCNQTDGVAATSPPDLPHKPPPTSPNPRKTKKFQPMTVIFSFIIVMIIAFMMLCAFHYAFRLPLVVTISVSCGLFLLFLVGSILWIHARCSLALVFPNLASTCGQVVLLSVITALLLHGPIANIVQNIGTVRQAVWCVDKAQQSLARSNIDPTAIDQLSHRDILRYHLTHFSERLDDFIKTIPYLDETSRHIFQSIGRHLEELEGVLDGITHGNTANPDMTCKRDVHASCQTALEGITELCDSYLDETIDSKAPWQPGWKIWCYSATTNRPMCNIFSTVCDARADDRPTREIKKAFDLFDAWRQTFVLLVMQMSIPSGGSPGTNVTNNGTRSDYGQGINERVQIAVDWIAGCLTLTIGSIFVYSVIFTVKWYTDDDFDNIYFRPSSTKERATRTDIRFVNMSSYVACSVETQRMKRVVLIIVLHLLLMTTVCLVDTGIFWLILPSNGTSKVNQGSVSVVGRKTTIKFSYTTSATARELDKLMSDMTSESSSTWATDTLIDKISPANDTISKSPDCLPRLSESVYGTYLAIAILYGVSFLLLFAQPYILRLRHRIACAFFPKRAGDRAQYLCTRLRKSRDRRLQELPETVKLNKTKCDRRKEVVDRLLCCAQAKRVLWYVVGCRSDQSRCLVCRKGKLTIKQNCAMENCDGVYCDHCFEELDRRCPLCQ